MGTYEIIIFGNLDFAEKIMTAITRLASSEAGMGLEKAAATVFFLAILLAFTKHFLDPDKNPHPGKEFVFGIVMFLMFISTETSPRVSVILSSPYGFNPDFTGSAPAYQIDGVPIIAALPAYITTNLFYGISNTVKQEFVTPAYDGYTSPTAALQALVRLHDHAHSVTAIDARLDASVKSYVNECLVPYAMMTANDSNESIITTLVGGQLQQFWDNARVTWDIPQASVYINADGEDGSELMPCPQAHEKIGQYIAENTEFGNDMQRHLRRFDIQPNALTAAYQMLHDGDTPNPHELATSAFLMSAVGNELSKSTLGNWSNLMIFEAQRSRAYQKTGDAAIWMNIMIPAITAIETFAFYIAPFVILMAMAGSYGLKVVMGYITLVVFINLWSFVQIFTDWYTMVTIDEITRLTDNTPITAANFTSVVIQMESYLTIAAALTSSIPALATFLLYRGVHSVMGVTRGISEGSVDSSRPSPNVSNSMNAGQGGMGNMAFAGNVNTGTYSSGAQSLSDNATQSIDLGATTRESFGSTATNIRSNTAQEVDSFAQQFSSQVSSAFQDKEGLSQMRQENFQNANEAQFVAGMAQQIQEKYNVTDSQAQQIAMQAFLRGQIRGGGGEDALVGGTGFGGGAGINAQVTGMLNNSFGLTDTDMENLQAQFADKESFNEMLNETEQNAQEWINNNGEQSSQTFQNIQSWSDNMTQAEQLQAMSTNETALSIRTPNDLVTANNYLGRDVAGTGNIYEGMYQDIKQMYMDQNGGNEAQALEQMRNDLGFDSVGGIRQLADNGTGQLYATNAMATVQERLSNVASTTQDPSMALATKETMGNIFDRAQNMAATMHDHSNAGFFGTLSEQYRGGMLSGSGRDNVDTNRVSADGPQVKSRDEIKTGTQQEVARKDSGGQVISPDDVRERVQAGRDRVESGLNMAREKLGANGGEGYEALNAYNMAYGWDNLKSAEQDQAEQGTISVGRVLNNLAGNLNNDNLSAGQAYGGALQQAAIDAGVNGAGAIGRGTELLMDKSGRELNDIASRAAQGDREALGQLMDIRTATAFAASDVGSDVLSRTLAGVDSGSREQFLNNFSNSEALDNAFKSSVSSDWMGDRGIELMDRILTNQGTEGSIGRAEAVTAMEHLTTGRGGTNFLERTYTQALNGALGDAPVDVLRTRSGNIEDAFQPTAQHAIEHRAYAAFNDENADRYAMSVGTRNEEFNEQNFNAAFNRNVQEDFINDNTVNGNFSASRGGFAANDGQIDAQAGFSQLRELGERSGWDADRAREIASQNHDEFSEAIKLSGVYGDELQQRFISADSGSLNQGETDRLQTYSDMVSGLREVSTSTDNGIPLVRDTNAVNVQEEEPVGKPFESEVNYFESNAPTLTMDEMAQAELAGGEIPRNIEVGTESMRYAGTYGDNPHDPAGYVYVDESGNAYYNSGHDGRLRSLGDINDVDYIASEDD